MSDQNPPSPEISRRAIAWEVHYGDRVAIEVGDSLYRDHRAGDLEAAAEEYYERYTLSQQGEQE